MEKFNRYIDNLQYDKNYIYSYGTKVAKIEGDLLVVLEGNWSVTTIKHINFAAKQLSLIKI